MELIRQRISSLLIVGFVVIVCTGVYAQPGFPFANKQPYTFSAKSTSTTSSHDTLSLVGQWSWGQSLAVVVRGNYALIGNGSLLQILDISNPVVPLTVGEVYVGSEIFGLVVSGNYAYMTPGFSIIDVSDVTNPRVVSNISVPSTTAALAVSGEYTYIGDIYGNIYTINVSDPTQPYVVSGYPMMHTQGYLVGSIVIVDTVLYAGTVDGTSADIFDISTPLSPVHILNCFGTRGVFAVQGHCLYLAATSPYDELLVYDISKPLNPRFINGANLRSFPVIISVRDSLVYICEANAGFEVVDVADTSNIHVLAQMPYLYNFPSGVDVGPYDLSLGSTIACIASINGLWIVDISKLPMLTTESFLATGWNITPSIVADTLHHAFVAEMYGGLQIIDFSTASSPRLIGQYTPNEAVRDVAVSKNVAYLLCDSDLVILDVSKLSTPVLMGKVAFGDTLDDFGPSVYGRLALYDSSVYVARNSGNLYAVDVSNPLLPVIKDIKLTSGIPTGISKLDRYLYIAEADTLVQVFDISNPHILKGLGSINISAIGGLNISGRVLFTLTESGFSKYKILDSFTVEYMGSCYLPIPYDFKSEITTDENYAYVCNGNYFNIINISNSSSPSIVYTDHDYYGFTSLAQSGNLFLLGRRGNSLLLLQNDLVTQVRRKPSLAESFALDQNYPNPFNPSTVISYQLPTGTLVTLKVYDELGRLVRTLVNENQNAGEHSFTFNASNLSSGIYFYRLSAGSFVQTKKLMLLK